jgi:hypothetical protein
MIGQKETCRKCARLGAQVGQVNVGLPAIDNGVGFVAGPLSRLSVAHCHLGKTSNAYLNRNKAILMHVNKIIYEVSAGL